MSECNWNKHVLKDNFKKVTCKKCNGTGKFRYVKVLNTDNYYNYNWETEEELEEYKRNNLKFEVTDEIRTCDTCLGTGGVYIHKNRNSKYQFRIIANYQNILFKGEYRQNIIDYIGMLFSKVDILLTADEIYDSEFGNNFFNLIEGNPIVEKKTNVASNLHEKFDFIKERLFKNIEAYNDEMKEKIINMIDGKDEKYKVNIVYCLDEDYGDEFDDIYYLDGTKHTGRSIELIRMLNGFI